MPLPLSGGVLEKSYLHIVYHVIEPRDLEVIQNMETFLFWGPGGPNIVSRCTNVLEQQHITDKCMHKKMRKIYKTGPMLLSCYSRTHIKSTYQMWKQFNKDFSSCSEYEGTSVDAAPGIKMTKP